MSLQALGWTAIALLGYLGTWVVAASCNPEIRPAWTLWWRKAPEHVTWTWEAYIRRLEKDCGIEWADSWFYEPERWPVAPQLHPGQAYTIVTKNGWIHHRYDDGTMAAIRRTPEERAALLKDYRRPT